MICNISLAVQNITLNHKPLLLIDTCSLLDIVRAPSRTNIKHSHIQGAIDLAKKAQSGHIYIAITNTVDTEFKAHLTEVCTELERYIQNLESKNSALIDAIESVGLSYSFTIDGLADQKLPEKLSGLANDLLAQAFTLERDAECGERAHTRVELAQAPASRGKSESKDCLIIEHYLELARLLRSATYNEKIVFVTSNTKDYGDPGKLRPPLELQFQTAQIEYCNNFAWALKISGVV